MDAGTVFLAALVTALATRLGALPFVFVPQMSRSWLGIPRTRSRRGSCSARARRSFGRAETTGSSARCSKRRRRGVHRGDAEAAGPPSRRPPRDPAGRRRRQSAPDRRRDDGPPFTESRRRRLVRRRRGARRVHHDCDRVHNIPEGLAISPCSSRVGSARLRAGAWSVFSSLPQPLMAVPAFLLVEWFEPVLAVGLGFAGRAMVWMVASATRGASRAVADSRRRRGAALDGRDGAAPAAAAGPKGGGPQGQDATP